MERRVVLGWAILAVIITLSIGSLGLVSYTKEKQAYEAALSRLDIAEAFVNGGDYDSALEACETFMRSYHATTICHHQILVHMLRYNRTPPTWFCDTIPDKFFARHNLFIRIHRLLEDKPATEQIYNFGAQRFRRQCDWLVDCGDRPRLDCKGGSNTTTFRFKHLAAEDQ